ncbi:MAG: hypothetical protein IJA78_01345, partial [Clostridia bacterium]|nr:hypothetical protein [Clostridia bacterium]
HYITIQGACQGLFQSFFNFFQNPFSHPLRLCGFVILSPIISSCQGEIANCCKFGTIAKEVFGFSYIIGKKAQRIAREVIAW